MEALINSNSGTEIIEVPKDESGFYKAIAEHISKMDYPNSVTVEILGRKIEYSLEERGGTCNIQERHNDFQFKTPGTYPKVYLTYADFVSAEKKAKEARGELKLGGDYGSYKFYSLEEDNGQIKASWGSMRGIGAQKSCYYKNSMYWIKYYEKINKGYIDNSDAYVEKEDEPKVKLPGIRLPEKNPINKLSQKLYNLLSNSSISLIKRTIKAMHVTQGMVNESKKFLSLLYQTNDVEDFNATLLKLCMVCPRKVWDMKQLMAKTKKDIPKILEREEDLVTAMEGLLLKQQTAFVEDETKKADEGPADPFKDINIEVSECDDKGLKLVNSMLPKELQQKVRTVYKINSPEHAKRFEEYCNQNNISKTKFLWHGSRNENWLSIIKLGLLLKPNAKITGKMFGNGIYFAPKAEKSWGYTSGGYWTRERIQGFAMMGVYETAYGDPYYPTSGENWNFTQNFLTKEHKNCVHAEGGSCGLRNDEIIFYDEGAMCLRYVVEFGN